MPGPGSFPLADMLGSVSSVMVLLLLAAVLLVFWQVAILLGALIANLLHPDRQESPRELEAG
jgi:hypothetical protein